MKQAIIFDMDGTLFQTHRILGPALEVAFTKLRQAGKWHDATPLDTYEAIMGVPLPQVWATLLPAHPETDRKQMDDWFQQALIERIQSRARRLVSGCGDDTRNTSRGRTRVVCRE